MTRIARTFRAGRCLPVWLVFDLAAMIFRRQTLHFTPAVRAMAYVCDGSGSATLCDFSLFLPHVLTSPPARFSVKKARYAGHFLWLWTFSYSSTLQSPLHLLTSTATNTASATLTKITVISLNLVIFLFLYMVGHYFWKKPRPVAINTTKNIRKLR